MQDRRELIVEKKEPATNLAQFENSKIMADPEPYRMYRGGQPEESVQLLDYWRAIRKRLWLIIGIAIIATTLTAIYMSRRPNIYDSTARVQVDMEQVNPELKTGERRGPIPNNDPSYFNTQLQILTSESLLRRVVKEIDLENNKEFMPPKGDESAFSVRGILKLAGLSNDKKKEDENKVPLATNSGESAEEIAEAMRLSPFVLELKKNLRVDPVRESRSSFKETRLIDITYRHTSAELATLIVNTIATAFSKNNEEIKGKKSGKTNTFLQDRIASLQSELERDEKKLAQLKQDGNILKLDENATITLEGLRGIQKNLLDAENKRKDLEAQLNAAKKPEFRTALTESGPGQKFITDTTQAINALRQRRNLLLEEYVEGAPEIKEVDTQINTLTKALDEFRQTAQKNFLTEIEAKYRQIKEQEEKIRIEYNRQFNEAEKQNQAGIAIKLLEQNLETKRDLLKNLNTSVRENDIEAVGTENNIRVVDSAIPPTEPVGPRRLLNVIIALFLSTAFGVGLALFLEYLDDTVRTTDDVENVLRLPALAVIPSIDISARRRLLLVGANEDPKARVKTELLINADPRSALSEAYRQLRTSILLSTAGHAPKSLLITSSVPSEGKTTTAVNTATSLAQTGVNVLIIDADMRRPRLHNIFGIGNNEGLSTILSSAMDEKEILKVIHQDPESNLYMLTSGPVPPNPAELIGSEQMRNLVRILENNFTHIIIDSPPIASFTDGVLIASMVSGVLLVVHSGKSSRHIIKRSRQLLSDVGAKIFGVVLNNVNLKSHSNSYYYYQNYYYQNYYNEDRN
jgi:capsular exopolysaccharide synthesis family protein